MKILRLLYMSIMVLIAVCTIGMEFYDSDKGHPLAGIILILYCTIMFIYSKEEEVTMMKFIKESLCWFFIFWSAMLYSVAFISETFRYGPFAIGIVLTLTAYLLSSIDLKYRIGKRKVDTTINTKK